MFNGRVLINPITGAVTEATIIRGKAWVGYGRRTSGMVSDEGRTVSDRERMKRASPVERSHDREVGTITGARRALRRLHELVACNPWDWFFTLTIDPKRRDSFDIDGCVKYAQRYFNNRVQRLGIRYLFVPELHKSGRVHFHGLVAGERFLPVLDPAGHVSKQGRPVYHIDDWIGFTTACKVDGDNERIANYIGKYITKGFENGERIGGRYYYHGGRGFAGYGQILFSIPLEKIPDLEICRTYVDVDKGIVIYYLEQSAVAEALLNAVSLSTEGGVTD